MVGRKPFVGGNWKCNGTVEFTKSFIQTLNDAGFDSSRVDVLVSPTFIHLPIAKEVAKENIIVAAQNSWRCAKGAFTGEISADMLIDLGIEWVILGHSERRHVCGETDELLAEKMAYAMEKGLHVVFCVGEKLEDRDGGRTNDVLRSQLGAVVSKVKDWSRVVVAYEPVWAIGTGVVAQPEQAEDAHREIRQFIAEQAGQEVADGLRIIYGGSVNKGNCKGLIAREGVDGFLVGGASLKPEFIDIVKSTYDE